MKLKNTSWQISGYNNKIYTSEIAFKGWFCHELSMEVYVHPSSDVYMWSVYFVQDETMSGTEPDLESAKKAAEKCALDLFCQAVSND